MTSQNIESALSNLGNNLGGGEIRTPIPFRDFLELVVLQPEKALRNVFQVFHDMIRAYVGEGVEEYPDDPESINFVFYDCNRLFVEGADHPFFADRLFANRLFNHIEAMRQGAQQNKLYIFEGPPGSGKSTFLNNLLMRFEEFANTEDGSRLEVVWRLDPREFCAPPPQEPNPLVEKLLQLMEGTAPQAVPLLRTSPGTNGTRCQMLGPAEYVEVPCPSHDHPILMIPKMLRRAFLDDLFQNDELKWTLFTNKEYDWVFRDNPCTICSALYSVLLNRLGSPNRVFDMLWAQRYVFNRRLGQGISVFNPGDRPVQQNVLTNPILQQRIDCMLHDSTTVRYIYSQYARTHNGIYSLMDIKQHNTERMIELHNIISEGVHKVEDIEENVNSLFIALMNPEDKKNIEGIHSFSDRVEYIKIPYVLDLNTEVGIYLNIFGRHITDSFLPRVLHNFARIIIATRLSPRSDALLEWITDPKKYNLYCDENLLLLKMEIYTGHIPSWLDEEDRKTFNAKRRRRIIAESELEGERGLSGRDSIKIFNDFYTTYAREDALISMSQLLSFFTNVRKDLIKHIPVGFMESLTRMYDYTVLQVVKESLYSYNEEQIDRDIQNYLFCINFEPGAEVRVTYTGDRLELSREFFDSLEHRLLGAGVTEEARRRFRHDTQKEYTARTLTQEIRLEGRPITETSLFLDLRERYVHNLKEKVLEPFLENENFRRAIKDFGEEDFRTYDQRIQTDVGFLMENLCTRHRYTPQGAKEVCIYVIDNDLVRKYGAGH